MATHTHNTDTKAGEPALTASDVHLKAIHLHGILAVLQEFEPHDLRTRNGHAALIFVAEELAHEVSRDMEKLMDAERGADRDQA